MLLCFFTFLPYYGKIICRAWQSISQIVHTISAFCLFLLRGCAGVITSVWQGFSFSAASRKSKTCPHMQKWRRNLKSFRFTIIAPFCHRRIMHNHTMQIVDLGPYAHLRSLHCMLFRFLRTLRSSS